MFWSEVVFCGVTNFDHVLLLQLIQDMELGVNSTGIPEGTWGQSCFQRWRVDQGCEMYVQAASSPIGWLPNKPALIGRSGNVFAVPHTQGWHLFPLATNSF